MLIADLAETRAYSPGRAPDDSVKLSVELCSCWHVTAVHAVRVISLQLWPDTAFPISHLCLGQVIGRDHAKCTPIQASECDLQLAIIMTNACRLQDSWT